MKQGTGRIEIFRPVDLPAEPSALGNKKLLTLVVAASLPGLAGANSAGTVDFAAGNVMVVYTNGNRETLSKGMSVNEGDTIRTGYRGLAQIRFSDGSYVSVQKGSAFRIDEYSYEPETEGEGIGNLAKKVNKGLFSLLQGGFRTITGFLGVGNYEVKTPVATIGIRGTEYLAELGRSLTVNVAKGALEVCNEAGCHFFRTNEAGYIEDQNRLIQRLRDLGLDIVVSTERGETIASLEQDETFRFKIHEEVDEDGESTLLDEEVLDDGSSGQTRLDCSAGNCTAAFGWVQGSTYDLDVVTSVLADFDGDVMVSHNGGGVLNEDTPGTTTPQAAGFTGNIAWGRWTGGVTTSGLDAVHYAIGTPTPNINDLSGSYTFSVIGFTNPTVANNGDLGSFDRVTGSFDADFDASQVFLDFTVEFANGKYSFASGSSPLMIMNDGTFNGIASVSGGPPVGSLGSPTCQDTGCNGAVSGFFSGNNASDAGLSYHVQDPGSAGDITGVVVFGKD